MTPRYGSRWIEVSSEGEDKPRWNIWGLVIAVAFFVWALTAFAAFTVDQSSSVLVGENQLFSAFEVGEILFCLSLVIMACTHVKKIQAWFDRKQGN